MEKSVSMSKTAFITGATSGFGLATARKLARNGWRLVLAGRRSDRLAEISTELQELSDVHAMTLDVCDIAQVKKIPELLPEAFRDIGLLVNNAGLALGTEPADRCDLDDWERMVQTNVMGLAAVTRSLLPTLIRAGAGSSIVNLGSIAGRWPYPGGNVYCGTKAFVEQFSLSLRCDLAGTGVRVTNLAPGLSESEFTLVRTGGNQAAYDDLYKGADPIQPNDVADMVVWIATQPAHLNINQIEVMPVSQAWSPFSVHRKSV